MILIDAYLFILFYVLCIVHVYVRWLCNSGILPLLK